MTQPAPLPPHVLALLHRQRPGGWVFTSLMSAGLLVGAAIIGLVVLTSGAPMALVVGLVLAALPVGPLIACFLWLDRYEPEPAGLLAAALGWGALVATAVALVLQLVERAAIGLPNSWSGAVTAPITEEAAKGLFVVVLIVARRNDLHGVLDGIVYAGLVGVGFAFTENILYLASAYTGGEELGPGGLGAATGTFIIRGIFSPFAHPLFTSAIGIGIGFAVVTRRAWLRLLAPVVGYVVAVLAHAAWNASAFFAGGQLFAVTYLFAMVPAFLLVAGLAVWARSREGRLLVRALNDCAYRGYLPVGDLPWLVRLPARRTAREHARGSGGDLAEKVVRTYQQQAVELGFLHDRVMRGSAPHNAGARGQQLVTIIASLRPYVMFPPPAGIHWTGHPQLEGGP